jgi:hypothetical protein
MAGEAYVRLKRRASYCRFGWRDNGRNGDPLAAEISCQ